jgi:hypothetical protein
MLGKGAGAAQRLDLRLETARLERPSQVAVEGEALGNNLLPNKAVLERQSPTSEAELEKTGKAFHKRGTNVTSVSC